MSMIIDGAVGSETGNLIHVRHQRKGEDGRHTLLKVLGIIFVTKDLSIFKVFSVG